MLSAEKNENVVVRKAMIRRILETLALDNIYACLPMAFHTKSTTAPCGSAT